MPSSLRPVIYPPDVVLHDVKTVEDAAAFIRTRTSDTHPLGADPKKVLKRLKRKGLLSLIIKDGDGNLLGTATVSETEPSIGVVGIALLPEARGKGYGSAALKEIERLAADQGFIALRADIFDENTASLALFNKAGFRRYTLMEKGLAPAA